MVDAVLKVVLHVPSNYLRQIIRYDPSTDLVKRLKPDLDVWIEGAYQEFRFHLTTDTEGFRNSYSCASADARYDLFFLGDSQTVGVGVDDAQTIPSFVAATSQKRVLNTACYGYSNLEELALYRETAVSHPARRVVLCFFAGNDPYENFKHKKMAEADRNIGTKGPQTPFENMKKFLKQNSSIYNLLDRSRRWEVFNSVLGTMGAVTSQAPDELLIFKKNTSDAKPFWDATEEAITALAGEARRNGAQFLILFVPDRYQIDEGYWRQWIDKYHLDLSDFDLSIPNRSLEKFSREMGIEFLDATPFLKTAGRAGTRVYWSIDSHLNLAGNRVVAEALSEYLRVSG